MPFEPFDLFLKPLCDFVQFVDETKNGPRLVSVLLRRGQRTPVRTAGTDKKRKALAVKTVPANSATKSSKEWRQELKYFASNSTSTDEESLFCSFLLKDRNCCAKGSGNRFGAKNNNSSPKSAFLDFLNSKNSKVLKPSDRHRDSIFGSSGKDKLEPPDTLDQYELSPFEDEEPLSKPPKTLEGRKEAKRQQLVKATEGQSKWKPKPETGASKGKFFEDQVRQAAIKGKRVPEWAQDLRQVAAECIAAKKAGREAEVFGRIERHLRVPINAMFDCPEQTFRDHSEEEPWSEEEFLV